MVTPATNTSYKTSYVFPQRYPLVREEGRVLFRVSVSSRKLTMFEKQLIRTAKSGVLFERVNKMTTYMLCENSSGKKYLKVLTKERGSTVRDSSLSVLQRTALVPHLQANNIDSPLRELIERQILSWFDYSYTPGLADLIKSGLLFPALDDGAAPLERASDLPKTLAFLQKDMGTITKPLRENSKWSEFLKELCPNTIVTKEDVAAITDRPHLLHVATLNLGMTISELREMDKAALAYLHKVFYRPDHNLIRFMLNNLPEDERKTAFNSFLSISKAYLNQDGWTNGSLDERFNVYSDTHRGNLKRVPKALRPILARNLASALTLLAQRVETDDKFFLKAVRKAMTKLDIVFQRWFAKNVINPSLKSETTRAEVETLLKEYFGWLPTNQRLSCGGDYMTTIEGYEFWGARQSGPIEYQKDLFSGLVGILKNPPAPRGEIDSRNSAFINEKGRYSTVPSDLYSMDDVVKVIKDGVVEVDARLAKLGREITPENRAAYLTYAHRDRKFKNTWRYYDLGITDTERMLALKLAKVTKKADILLYAALPDDMFYDFITTETNGEVNPDRLGIALGV